jgi:outer membrane protein TolC
MQIRYLTGLLYGMLCTGIALAEPVSPEPLPNPLTLDHALALADDAHPDIELAKARLSLSQAQASAAEAQTGLEISGQVLPQYVQRTAPALAFQNSDNQAHLLVTKRLYDFGASAAQRDAANSLVASSSLDFLDVRQKRRIEIMRHFFGVLLADLRYMVDNEAMAAAYVNYDRIRERHQLGQISAVDLAENETNYRELLVRRNKSQIEQRSSRQRLANALNRPGELADKLVRPPLNGNEREIPEFDVLLKSVQESNPGIQRLRQEVESAEAALAAAQKKSGPTLDAEFQTSYYEREAATRDKVRAALNLRIPIYQGGRDDADVAKMQALLQNKQAELKKAEFDLRQKVLDLVQQLELLKVEQQTARTRSDYRDLYLDRSRALYEMEAQVTLGDAMTKLTEAQWRAAKVEFDLAIAWARLEAMRGTLIAAPQENK